MNFLPKKPSRLSLWRPSWGAKDCVLRKAAWAAVLVCQHGNVSGDTSFVSECDVCSVWVVQLIRNLSMKIGDVGLVSIELCHLSPGISAACCCLTFHLSGQGYPSILMCSLCAIKETFWPKLMGFAWLFALERHILFNRTIFGDWTHIQFLHSWPTLHAQSVVFSLLVQVGPSGHGLPFVT